MLFLSCFNHFAIIKKQVYFPSFVISLDFSTMRSFLIQNWFLFLPLCAGVLLFLLGLHYFGTALLGIAFLVMAYFCLCEAGWQFMVMLDPAGRSRRMSIADSFLHYYKVSLIPVVISPILAVRGVSVGISSIAAVAVLAVFAFFPLFFWIILPMIMAFMGLVLHTLGTNANAFKGSLEDTFSVLSYAASSFVLFIWLIVFGYTLSPFLGAILFILLISCSLYVGCLCIAKLHNWNDLSSVALLLAIGLAILLAIVFNVASMFPSM